MTTNEKIKNSRHVVGATRREVVEVPDVGEHKGDAPIHGQELGRRLRAARQAAGFSGVELSRLVGIGESRVSRLLSGQVRATVADVAAVLAVCGVFGVKRDRILDLCHPRHEAEVLRLSDGTQWDAFLYHAGQAQQLTEYQPLMIPWLVQSDVYSRAYHSAPDQCSGPWAEKLNHGSAIGLLVDVEGIELLVHEWALRAPIGTRAERADQIHGMLTMSSARKFSLRVIPAAWPIPMAALSGFTMLEYAHRRPLLYREEPTCGVFVDDPHQVQAHLQALKELRRGALTEPASRQLMEQIKDEPAPEPEQPSSKDGFADTA